MAYLVCVTFHFLDKSSVDYTKIILASGKKWQNNNSFLGSDKIWFVFRCWSTNLDPCILLKLKILFHHLTTYLVCAKIMKQWNISWLKTLEETNNSINNLNDEVLNLKVLNFWWKIIRNKIRIKGWKMKNKIIQLETSHN